MPSSRFVVVDLKVPNILNPALSVYLCACIFFESCGFLLDSFHRENWLVGLVLLV